MNCLVTTAESCTGGAIAAALTEVAGSSAWYDQGWVTYSADGKHHQLGVDLALLKNTMVSQEVAMQMAFGALQRSCAQLAVSVTGVAGPSGGSLETPIGCCWFGFAFAQEISTFFGDRAVFEQRLQAFKVLSQFQSIQSISCMTHADIQHILVCCQWSGDRSTVRASAVEFTLQFLTGLFEDIVFRNVTKIT